VEGNSVTGFNEYPIKIQVGLRTVIIRCVEERIQFAQRFPQSAHLVRINRIDCERQGIDPSLFDEPEPLSENEQRRLLFTLATQPEFRQAFLRIVGNAPAGGGQHG